MEASADPLKRQGDQLLSLGAWLFLLGLITGLVVPYVANPRMGLSSHIEGVMNGMLLLILGLVWPRLELPAGWRKAVAWCSIYGTFANWGSLLVAAVLNAGGRLTVAAQGHAGSAFAEGVVDFGLASLSIAMLAASVGIIVGLRRARLAGKA